jgi:hypothetical protein
MCKFCTIPVTNRPEDYIDYGREMPLMQLGNTKPEHVLKIIKNFTLSQAVIFMVFLLR